jgi:putative DNA methylase
MATMIELTSGDMFDRAFDIRVNTVNCVGVMGAGVALAFKERYPQMFREYKRECDAGRIQPGHLHVWRQLHGDWIINFPTKRHWRENSRYEDIESGLKALRDYLADQGPVSIALPALGCGHGGLDWDRVSAMIRRYLDGSPARISVFEPKDSRRIGENARAVAQAVDEESLVGAGIHVVKQGDADYPDRMRDSRIDRLYIRGAADLLSHVSVALIVSFKPSPAEEVAALAMAEAIADRKVILSLTLAGPLARLVIESATQRGAKVAVWLPHGILAERVPNWLNTLVELGQAVVASVAPPKMRWAPGIARDTSVAAATEAAAVVVTDPEPRWIASAPWRARHEDHRSLFYVRYGDASEAMQRFWSQTLAKAIGKKRTGTPNVDPIVDVLRNYSADWPAGTVRDAQSGDSPSAEPLTSAITLEVAAEQRSMSNAPFPRALFEHGDKEDKVAQRTKRKTSAAKAAALADHLPPNLGKALKVAVPDFSDPNRPKTCLEVDFPLVPINALSALEGNAGKPIYQMSKWWARRRSCVFRALLLAAAMEAPTRKHPDGQPMLGPDGKPIVDEDAAAQLVWDAYYANHQLAGNFKKLKVLDPFMGGGTTLVEGSRLGFHVAGVDLNPVAWFIVKNELACTDPKEVKAFFDQIEAEVKPQIQPFYVTEGVGGKKGKWFKVGTNDKGEPTRELMPAGFDPIALPPGERKPFQYEGPEVIYTFWAKHGPCAKIGCGHRTPIFRSPIVATKKLGVKYLQCTCKKCKTVFHAELGDARIAPDAEQVVLDNEHPYTIATPAFARRMMEYTEGSREEKNKRIGELVEMVETEPGLKCPRCGTWSGQMVRDVLGMHSRAVRASEIDKKHLGILPKGVAKKPVYCTLLIDPEWLKGSPGEVGDAELGGYIDAPMETTDSWYRERLKNLRLIEVRGTAALGAAATVDGEGNAEEPSSDEEPGLPPTVVLSDGRVIDTRAETIARKANGKEWDSHFVCGACGTPQDFRLSVQRTRRTAPVMAYAIQAYDASRDASGTPYGGRYFASPSAADVDRMIAAEREWASRKDADLNGCWPREEMPFTYMTHQANFALPEQGYTHWFKMFNPRQLVVHAALLRSISMLGEGMPEGVREAALSAHQQYLQNHSMFCHYEVGWDKLAVTFANSNFRPRTQPLENNFVASMGRGNWPSCASGIIEGLSWAKEPEDTYLDSLGESQKARMSDPVLPGAKLSCRSSTDMEDAAKTFDLVITDPPFGDNIYYSDLSNFFHAWLRLSLKDTYPEQFGPTKTPNAQEALKPRALSDADGDKHYYDRLTPCWAEACRVMKDGGLMAFTFHHSEDAQWEIVLRSLFDAGFYLESTYPIASDEMKGKGGQFGAKGTEYDIIHVCRKRLEEPKPVSWPKMRQWVKAELARLRPLLESYKSRGLQDADVRVILRGKALEFYSRHYGKVLVSAPGGEDAVLSIRDALLGINQLLDESGGQPGERPPSIVQPVVYQYLRLFGIKPAYSRDEVSKLLRGTAIQQRDFEKTGSTPWISEEDKVISRVPIYERFQKMVKRSRRELKTELDQAHFLIGAAMPAREGDTTVNIEKELERETFLVRPGVEALLDWYSKTPSGPDEPGVAKAAGLALTLLRAAFEARRARMRQEDPKLFEEWEASMAVA